MIGLLIPLPFLLVTLLVRRCPNRQGFIPFGIVNGYCGGAVGMAGLVGLTDHSPVDLPIFACSLTFLITASLCWLFYRRPATPPKVRAQCLC